MPLLTCPQKLIRGDDHRRRARSRPDRIDLLVTDVVMPLMGGKEVASNVRATSLNVRVLFMSGFPDDDVDQELHLPTTDFMQKPFTRVDLMRKAHTLLAAEAVEMSAV